jgi:hypothetical protein
VHSMYVSIVEHTLRAMLEEALASPNIWLDSILQGAGRRAQGARRGAQGAGRRAQGP